jgi:DNA repair protein RadC
MKLLDLPSVDRPREKMLKYGPDKLSNSELLALLLRTGTKNLNVVELAESILRSFSGKGLVDAPVLELAKVYGLGEAKACEIVACFELGKRLLKDKKAALLLSPEDVARELKDIAILKKEHLVVFYLDPRLQQIKRETVSVGLLDSSLVHPREVFESAIMHSASAIIVAHNHPSGDIQPSENDIRVTRRLVRAGQVLGIEVIDHIIVAGTASGSLKEMGLWPAEKSWDGDAAQEMRT